MQLLPLSQIPGQSFSAVLGSAGGASASSGSGRHCTISLYWRQNRLYLDLDAGAAAICRGAICENRADIIQSPSRDFSGTLRFVDTEGDSPPPLGRAVHRLVRPLGFGLSGRRRIGEALMK